MLTVIGLSNGRTANTFQKLHFTYLYSINKYSPSFLLRIEVHFCLHWEMKGHWSRVNLVKREVYFDPCSYAKAKNNP